MGDERGLMEGKGLWYPELVKGGYCPPHPHTAAASTMTTLPHSSSMSTSNSSMRCCSSTLSVCPHLSMHTAVIHELGVGNGFLIRCLYHGHGFHSDDCMNFSTEGKALQFNTLLRNAVHLCNSYFHGPLITLMVTMMIIIVMLNKKIM